MAELVESVCRGNRISLGIMNAGGHDQRVIGIFVQMIIRLSEQRQTCGVPHDLVDADHLRRKAVKLNLIQAASRKLYQEDSAAVDRTYVDGAVKRNREPRPEIESV